MDIWEIKEQMKNKGISQIELAKQSKIPLQTLRKIFSGQTAHPLIDTMQAIEKALGLADGSPLDNARVKTLTEKERRQTKFILYCP